MAEQEPKDLNQGTEEPNRGPFWDAASENNYNNMKVVFDNLVTSLAGIGANAMTQGNAIFAQTMQSNKNVQTIMERNLSDMTENANLASKNLIEVNKALSAQILKHSDIATDRTWNVDEQGYQVADILNDSKFQDAIAAALAKITADMAAAKSD